MATTIIAGPYFVPISKPEGLAYGELTKFIWGPTGADGFCGPPGTFTVTAYASEPRRQTQFAMWVNDLSVSAVDIGTGDIDNWQYRVHATFGNNGDERETIHSYTAYISKVVP
jgi:hypothetical protein